MKPTNKLLGAVVCLAGALAFITSTAQAQNLLVDPSFEAAAFGQPNPVPIPGGVGGGWAAFQANLTVAAAHSGLQSAALWDNVWNPSGVYQIVPITAGNTYTLTAWFENTGAASSWPTPWLAQVQYADGAGVNIGGANGAWTAEGALGVWNQVTTVSVAPAGSALAKVYLMAMDGGVATGTKYFADDASFTVPEPASFALLGLGVASMLVWRRR